MGYPNFLIFLLMVELSGEWREDRFEGWGKLRYADQSEYEGDLHQGMRHGQVGLQFNSKIQVPYFFIVFVSFLHFFFLTLFLLSHSILTGPAAAPYAVYSAIGGRGQHDRRQRDFYLHSTAPTFHRPTCCSGILYS